jgi:hypothetical protein
MRIRIGHGQGELAGTVDGWSVFGLQTRDAGTFAGVLGAAGP